MAFVVFDAYGAAARPEATLRASGQLFLSRGILKRFGSEGGAFYCRLYFDEENDALGIRLFESRDVYEEDSIRDVSVEKSGIAINIIPLLRYYNFPLPDAKVMLPVSFGEDMILVNVQSLRERKTQPPLLPTSVPRAPAPPVPPVPRVPVPPLPPRRVAVPTPPTTDEHDFDDDIPF